MSAYLISSTVISFNKTNTFSFNTKVIYAISFVMYLLFPALLNIPTAITDFFFIPLVMSFITLNGNCNPKSGVSIQCNNVVLMLVFNISDSSFVKMTVCILSALDRINL